MVNGSISRCVVALKQATVKKIISLVPLTFFPCCTLIFKNKVQAQGTPIPWMVKKQLCKHTSACAHKRTHRQTQTHRFPSPSRKHIAPTYTKMEEKKMDKQTNKQTNKMTKKKTYSVMLHSYSATMQSFSSFTSRYSTSPSCRKSSKVLEHSFPCALCTYCWQEQH